MEQEMPDIPDKLMRKGGTEGAMYGDMLISFNSYSTSKTAGLRRLVDLDELYGWLRLIAINHLIPLGEYNNYAPQEN